MWESHEEENVTAIKDRNGRDDIMNISETQLFLIHVWRCLRRNLKTKAWEAQRYIPRVTLCPISLGPSWVASVTTVYYQHPLLLSQLFWTWQYIICSLYIYHIFNPSVLCPPKFLSKYIFTSCSTEIRILHNTSYSSILAIQRNDCLHWILSLAKLGNDDPVNPRFPYTDWYRTGCYTGIPGGKKSLFSRSRDSTGDPSTSCFDMIHECYQDWTTLNSNF